MSPETPPGELHPELKGRPLNRMVVHDYLSTACLHGVHQHCRQNCKYCDMLCRCDCHGRLTRRIDP